MQWGETGMWTPIGSIWSLAAGAAGAIGALGIIYAFNSGGKPVFVMPLVFGGAPIINTIDSVALGYMKTGAVGEISKPFLVSLGMVALGGVCVLLFAPKKPKPVESPNETVDEATDSMTGGETDDSPGTGGPETSEVADSTAGSNP